MTYVRVYLLFSMAEIVKILAGCKSVVTAHCTQSTTCPGFAFVFWERYPTKDKGKSRIEPGLAFERLLWQEPRAWTLARILPQGGVSVKCFRSPVRRAANRHGETCGYAYIPIYSQSDCSAPFIPTARQPIAGLFASSFAATAVRGCARKLCFLTAPSDRAYRDGNA